MMRPLPMLAIAAAALIAFAAAAEAATKKRSGTRITVQKRSYLNAGTQVKPGERKFTDYVFPPGYTAHSAYDPAGTQRSPLPGPFHPWN